MYTRRSPNTPDLNDNYIALPLDRDFTLLDVQNDASRTALSSRRGDEETVAWRSILSDLTGLRDLTQTLAENVHENEQDLSAIESHVQSTAQQTGKTVQELSEARKSLWNARRNIIIFILVIFCVGTLALYSVHTALL